VEDFAKDKERLTERWNWASQDYSTERDRLSERKKWVEEESKIENGRFETRRKWLLTDMGLGDEQMKAEIKYRTQLHDLEAKQHGETLAMWTTLLNESELHLKNMKAIDDQLRSLQRRNWTDEQLAATQALANQKTHVDNLRAIEDLTNKVDVATIALLKDMATRLGADGDVATALDQALTQMDARIAAMGTNFNAMVDSVNAYAYNAILETGGTDVTAIARGTVIRGNRDKCSTRHFHLWVVGDIFTSSRDREYHISFLANPMIRGTITPRTRLQRTGYQVPRTKVSQDRESCERIRGVAQPG
jgi:hypothetical protein